MIAALLVVLMLVAPAPASAAPRSHHYPCAPTGGPAPFQDYWLGESFEGVALEHQAYECRRGVGDPEEFALGPRSHRTGSTYGPVSVQVWPACERTLSTIDLRHGSMVRRRGVPTTTFEGGHRLEVYTGDVTVVIFAGDPRQAERAVAALRTPAQQTPQTLPAPIKGHLTQRLFCGLAPPRVRLAGTPRPGGRKRCPVQFRRCRVATLEIDSPARGFLGGDVPGALDNGLLGQLAIRVPRGRSHRKIMFTAPGRWRGTVRVTARDRRHSRDVEVGFRVP